ncbi:MAG TPA: tRNA (adenosine(37)-N6)-threonylcarbamoyltransferase complex dimerization subunit type 1 TsaB [Longimicrobiales bacterium]
MTERIEGGNLLALDTSTPTGSVAVGRAGRLLAEVVMGVAVRHAEALMPALDFALGRAGLQPADLAGIVVAGGPGSFTGVRIAGAAAKGLARALDVPLYAYSGLLALAAGAAASDRPVCALFDARRDEVYAGCYRFNGAVSTLLEPAPRPLTAVLEALAGEGALFLGDGALRHRARIEASGARVAPPHLAVPRASTLLWLVDVHPAGRVSDVAAWEPAYLRPSGAERAACG